MISFSMARVRATYNSAPVFGLRLLCIDDGGPGGRRADRRKSGQAKRSNRRRADRPGRCWRRVCRAASASTTTGNSSPLDLWMVISRTAPSASGDRFALARAHIAQGVDVFEEGAHAHQPAGLRIRQQLVDIAPQAAARSEPGSRGNRCGRSAAAAARPPAGGRPAARTRRRISSARAAKRLIRRAIRQRGQPQSISPAGLAQR